MSQRHHHTRDLTVQRTPVILTYRDKISTQREHTSARGAHTCHKCSVRCWKAEKFIVQHTCNAGCIVKVLARFNCSIPSAVCQHSCLQACFWPSSTGRSWRLSKGFLNQSWTGGVSKREISRMAFGQWCRKHENGCEARRSCTVVVLDFLIGFFVSCAASNGDALFEVHIAGSGHRVCNSLAASNVCLQAVSMQNIFGRHSRSTGFVNSESFTWRAVTVCRSPTNKRTASQTSLPSGCEVKGTFGKL